MNKKNAKQMKQEYFTRMPTKYIRENIKEQFGVSRKFYITYILIDRYRSIEDFSWMGTLDEFCKKYKIFRWLGIKSY